MEAIRIRGWSVRSVVLGARLFIDVAQRVAGEYEGPAATGQRDVHEHSPPTQPRHVPSMSSAEREQAVFALHQTRGNTSLLKAELVQDREMPADPRAFFQKQRKQHTPVAVRAGEFRRGRLVELEIGTYPLIVTGEQL